MAAPVGALRWIAERVGWDLLACAAIAVTLVVVLLVTG